jgi:hypothetical protein
VNREPLTVNAKYEFAKYVMQNAYVKSENNVKHSPVIEEWRIHGPKNIYVVLLIGLGSVRILFKE